MERLGEKQLESSFRDSASYVFSKDGCFFRRFTPSGLADYSQFLESGLSKTLVEAGLLVDFQQCGQDDQGAVIQLDTLPFISYPYEWCFSQLKDAAVLTLDVAEKSLEHGMILKDASAFNVAWRQGKPIFIDHGSFTTYIEGRPWQAYRQFVMHFLAPLLLMRNINPQFLRYFSVNLDGFPLNLTSRMLPWMSWLSPTALMHIHWHAILERRHSAIDMSDKPEAGTFSKKNMVNLLAHLKSCVSSLKSPTKNSEWQNYYENTNYSRSAMTAKLLLVEKLSERVPRQRIIDLGANDGRFSMEVGKNAETVIAADIDYNAIESLYSRHLPNIYPVVQDFSNPSVSCGVLGRERMSFSQRAQGDLVLGLAIVHHLRIGANWTIRQIVELFAECAPSAIIEFVPKEDSQVQGLLLSRKDIYDDWTLDIFLAELGKRYSQIEHYHLPDSERTIIFAKDLRCVKAPSSTTFF